MVQSNSQGVEGLVVVHNAFSLTDIGSHSSGFGADRSIALLGLAFFWVAWAAGWALAVVERWLWTSLILVLTKRAKLQLLLRELWFCNAAAAHRVSNVDAWCREDLHANCVLRLLPPLSSLLECSSAFFGGCRYLLLCRQPRYSPPLTPLVPCDYLYLARTGWPAFKALEVTWYSHLWGMVHSLSLTRFMSALQANGTVTSSSSSDSPSHPLQELTGAF